MGPNIVPTVSIVYIYIHLFIETGLLDSLFGACPGTHSIVTRLASNSQSFTCLCLPSVGVKGVRDQYLAFYCILIWSRGETKPMGIHLSTGHIIEHKESAIWDSQLPSSSCLVAHFSPNSLLRMEFTKVNKSVPCLQGANP